MNFFKRFFKSKDRPDPLEAGVITINRTQYACNLTYKYFTQIAIAEIEKIKNKITTYDLGVENIGAAKAYKIFQECGKLYFICANLNIPKNIRNIRPLHALMKEKISEEYTGLFKFNPQDIFNYSKSSGVSNIQQAFALQGSSVLGTNSEIIFLQLVAFGLAIQTNADKSMNEAFELTDGQIKKMMDAPYTEKTGLSPCGFSLEDLANTFG